MIEKIKKYGNYTSKIFKSVIVTTIIGSVLLAVLVLAIWITYVVMPNKKLHDKYYNKVLEYTNSINNYRVDCKVKYVDEFEWDNFGSRSTMEYICTIGILENQLLTPHDVNNLNIVAIRFSDKDNFVLSSIPHNRWYNHDEKPLIPDSVVPSSLGSQRKISKIFTGQLWMDLKNIELIKKVDFLYQDGS